MLVTMKLLLDIAKKEGGFAIPAPNVWTIETIDAAYQAAREMNSPIILGVWDGGADWVTEKGAMVRLVDQKYPDVIAALNLDHGSCEESELAALKAGFTSIMVDRSTMPFEENIQAVKKMVDIAHSMNVSVEAELGHVGNGLEYETTRDPWLTNKDEANEYVEKTKCDMLAVAVGTSHGIYQGSPYLDFELLKELNASLTCPLVLHGGSGTGDENLRKAVEIGIHKVNLCSDLMRAFEAAIERVYKARANEPWTDDKHLDYFSSSKEGFKKELMHYMEVLNSMGKADLYGMYKAAKTEGNYYTR